MAALLAEQKFLATREFLTAKDGGLYNTYANGGKPEAVTADLGQRWELEQIALRLWPSASSIQGMNTALFDLIEKHTIDPDQVKKLRIALSQTVFDLHGMLASYKAKFEALISAHYIAAVILHDRELTLAQFEPARYDDPKLRRAAAEQVEVRPDPALERRAGDGRDRDGRRQDALVRAATIRAARPRTRCRARRSRASSAPMRRACFPPPHIDETIAAVNSLEDLGSVRRLMDMLRAGPRRAERPRAAARG